MSHRNKNNIVKEIIVVTAHLSTKLSRLTSPQLLLSCTCLNSFFPTMLLLLLFFSSSPAPPKLSSNFKCSLQSQRFSQFPITDLKCSINNLELLSPPPLPLYLCSNLILASCSKLSCTRSSYKSKHFFLTYTAASCLLQSPIIVIPVPTTFV